MTEIYYQLLLRTSLPRKVAGGISFYLCILFWFCVGAAVGVVFCRVTGSMDYQNTIGGTGAFCALFFGVMLGLPRLLHYD